MRTLPLRLEPVDGEAFASYNDRLAECMQLPLSTLLFHTGVIARDHASELPTGYGIDLSEGERDQYCKVTEVDPEVLDRMLVSSLVGRCISWDIDDAAVRNSDRRIAGQWFHSACSHFCPDCIRENGAWKLAWKTPWAFMCLRHDRLLASNCPSCHMATGRGRGDRSSAPVMMTRVPSPKTCQRPEPKGLAKQGRAAERCGYPLGTVETEAVPAGAQMIDVQREIMNRLSGPPSAESVEYFQMLRSFTAMYLLLGREEDFEMATSQGRSAVALHIEGRLNGTGEGEGGKGRTRYWTREPFNAALMSEILPRANDVVKARDNGTLDAVLGPLARRVREVYASSAGQQIPSWYWFPHDVAEEFDRQYRATTPRYALKAASTDGPELLEPRNIPRLFWKDQFDSHLAEWFAGSSFGEKYARLACSVAAAKYLTGGTWVEAGEVLGIGAKRARTLGNRLVSYLTSEEVASEDFWGRMQAAIESVRDGGGADVDYRQREAELSNFTSIPRADWKQLTSECGVGAGNRGGRERYAAAWLWGELTGNDWCEAPVFGGHAGENHKEVMRRYLRDFIPAIEAKLLEYGGDLLKGHAGSRKA